jgi:tRNA G26 N,N-dimethylase Trm1
MITFSCFGCGKEFRVEDQYAGKRTKCPKCGGSLEVPPGIDLIELVDEEVEQTAQPEVEFADALKIHAQQKAREFKKAAEQARLDHEPWYYGFLAFCSKAAMILDTLGTVVLTVLAFAYSNEKMPVARGIVLTWLWIQWVASVFTLSFFLLAVDAARNLRAMRQAESK